MDEAVPQEARATAISTNKIVTANAFFFIAQCVFWFTGRLGHTGRTGATGHMSNSKGVWMEISWAGEPVTIITVIRHIYGFFSVSVRYFAGTAWVWQVNVYIENAIRGDGLK